MVVRMYMSGPAIVIDPSASPQEAVALMRAKRVRRLVVVAAEEVVGIVSQRDLARAAERANSPNPVAKLREIMKSPVVTVGRDEPIEKAASLMTRHHIGSLAVLHAGKLAGIITESDIFRAFAFLLTGEGRSARITFDIGKGDETLGFLVRKTAEMGLQLRSFLTFKDGDRLMAVARIRGPRLKQFVDDLWESGQIVVNVVHLD